MYEYIRIVYLILTEHILHRLLIQPRQRLRTIQLNPTKLGLRDMYRRRLPIQPNTHLIQLPRNLHSLLFSLTRIQHHQYHIGILRDGDDLSSSAFTFGGTFDDTGEIQELDFGVVVVDDTGDAG